MDPRLAYDDPGSPQQMAHDGRVTGRRLALLEQAAHLAPAPGTIQSRATSVATISVEESAVRLAARHTL